MDRILSLEDRKRVSLEILCHFIDYCDNQNLKYCLAYGTLIGAIRHKGFIPWDDDIDVFMPREDYERFLKDYKETEDFAVVSCWNNRSYHLPYAKVVAKYTGELEKGKKINPLGIGIDLFPLEKLSANRSQVLEILNNCANLYRNIIVQCMYYRRKPLKGLKNFIQHYVGEFSYKSGYLNGVARKIDRICKNNQVADSNMVCSILGLESDRGFQIFEDTMFDRIEKPFENHECAVPCGYDLILRTYYGDYMKLPPVEQQKSTHSSTFVWLEK